MAKYCKYYQAEKMVTYNGGLTWHSLEPPQYGRGSLIERNSPDCGYEGFETQYLTFEALEPASFTWTQSNLRTIQYSLDSGSTWNTLNSSESTPTISAGQTVMWKNSNAPGTYETVGHFEPTGKYIVYGNIMSLVWGNDFIGKTTLPSGDYFAFNSTFSCMNDTGNTNLISAENLIIPVLNDENFSCQNMFYGCTGLTTPPELPATALTNSCYSQMFLGCTSLARTPKLPATILANSCYFDMFMDCTSLTTAPTLNATTLAPSCYKNMFDGCTSLRNVQSVLPATTLPTLCYENMFGGCTSLTTAPEICGTTLSKRCCYGMFADCSRLTTVQSVLPATTTAELCYAFMFLRCTSLTTAPELPASVLRDKCYVYMFSGCEKLNYIKCLATDIGTYDSEGVWRPTLLWTQKVASSGTFVKKSTTTSWPTGSNGIPSNWTIRNV